MSDDSDLMTKCSSLRSYIRQKQLEVEKLKQQLEVNTNNCLHSARQHTNLIVGKAHELFSSTSMTVTSQSNEFSLRLDEVLKHLTEFQFQLGEIVPVSPTKKRNIDQEKAKARLDSLVKHVDEIFDSERDSRAYTTMKLEPSQLYSEFMRTTPLLRLQLSIPAERFKLKMLSENPDCDTNYNALWMEVKVTADELKNKPKFCKALCCAFVFVFEGLSIGKEQIVTFRELLKSNNVVNISDEGFCFKVPSCFLQAQDLIIKAFFCSEFISGSPQSISFRPNKSFRVEALPEGLKKLLGMDEEDQVVVEVEDEDGDEGRDEGKDEEDEAEKTKRVIAERIWETLNLSSRDPNNTRMKRTSDLDDSDMKAMGLGGRNDTLAARNVSCLTTVLEEEESRTEPKTNGYRDIPNMVQAYDRGPFSSPLVVRNLPLDQPSPLTPNTFSSNVLSNDVPQKNTHFTPKIASTMGNIDFGDMLKSMQIPTFPEEDKENEDHVDPSILHDDGSGSDLVARMQRNLSDDNNANDTKSNKNVSFSAHTTVYEMMTREKNRSNKNLTMADIATNLPTQPNVSLMELINCGKSDENSGSSFKMDVSVKQGETKTSDGDQKMFKKIMEDMNKSNGNDSTNIDSEADTRLQILSYNFGSADKIWSMSTEEWLKKKAEIEAVHSKPKSIIEMSMSDTLWDTHENEENKVSRRQPEYDLSSNKVSLALIKTCHIGGLPQSVTRPWDKGQDFTLVSDVENNKILKFKGWEEKGKVWPSTESSFFIPRYVLCLPENKVAVLDEKALYIFRHDGKKLLTLFDGEVRNFRGLAFYKEYGRLMTTEVKGGVVKLLIISDYEKCVAKAIDIKPTRDDVKMVKIRFMAYHKHTVYLSDLGMGRLYITSMKTEETKVVTSFVDGRNRLKNATGMAVDPAGNILVASAYHNRLELFTSEGDHSRTFSLAKTLNPIGLCLHSRNLYVVNGETKTLQVYTLAEQ